MGNTDRNRRLPGICRKVAMAALAATFVAVLATIGSQMAQAQTYSVIYNFTGGHDGASPEAGLTIDHGGNLYGTTNGGGVGFGAVLKLAHKGSSWIFNPLYSFGGGMDGAGTYSRVVFGPDGSLYGATYGTNGGFGTVFRLQPPATACRSALCPWTETVLYRFTGGSDGANPDGDLIFDQAGNIYGVTLKGGDGYGVVYELTRSGGGWTQSVLHTFEQGSGGTHPTAGVIFDKTGNLYGTAAFGGLGYGVVFQLTPSGSGWTENVLYTFTGGNDGGAPIGGVIFDSSGNLYGSTFQNGAGSGGTAFELMFQSGKWKFELLHSFAGTSGCGPQASLVFDQAGNLYGTTLCDGANGQGSVFELTPSNGSWTYTSLHDFAGGTDGGFPFSNLVFDANGNIYGTASQGGADGVGVIFQITP